MPKLTKYGIILDTSVGSTSTVTDPISIIPNNKIIRLTGFGGYDPIGSDGVAGIISLQWGSGTTWQTVRAGGYGAFDFQWERGIEFAGDGAKRFRIVRQNRSSVAKVMVAWLTGKLVKE